MIKVGRPINNINLNGLEYILDNENGNIKKFDNKIHAEHFLLTHGMTVNDFDYLIFEEIED